MLKYVRDAIAANGGTPSSYALTDSLRELVTTYGGTPTQYSVVGLMREAAVAVGGTPAKWSFMELLRELLEALGETVTSFEPVALFEQWASAVKSGGTGTALSAPTLTRTSGATTYPPTVDFTRPIDWIDGDQAVMQRSQDPTFATGVSEAVQTMQSGTITYDFGLSNITSGSWYMRMAAWNGSRPGSLNWSNIVNVGDTVAPTITSSATQSTTSISLTASELVTWAIVGGTDAALWQISGSTLSQIASVTTQSVHTVEVQATDYAGNQSSVQTITITLDIAPDAFSFTDVTGATTSTSYTSNTITVSGLGSGITVAVSVSGGQYSKNGGAYTSAAGTAQNGDTFAVQETSSSAGGTGVSTTLTIGSGSDTYTVTTTGFTPLDLWTGTENGDFYDATDYSTMWQDTAGTVPVTGVGQQVKRWVGKKHGRVLTAVATNGPTTAVDGSGFKYLAFTASPDTVLGDATLVQTCDASTGAMTMACAASVPDITSNRWFAIWDDGGSQRVGGIGQSSASARALSYTSSGAGFDTSGTLVASTPFTMMAIRTGTTVETFKDNVSDGATTVAGTISKVTSPLYVGGTVSPTPYTFNLYGGVVAISRALTSTELGNLHSWLAARS